MMCFLVSSSSSSSSLSPTGPTLLFYTFSLAQNNSISCPSHTLISSRGHAGTHVSTQLWYEGFSESAAVLNAQNWPSVNETAPDPTFSVPSSFTALSTMLRTSSSTRCNCRANKSAKVVASVIEKLTWWGRKRGRIYIPHNGSFYLMARGVTHS